MQLYNTLTRRKEEFEPAGDEVTMYVCGITTSGYSHIGHAFSSIVFEVLHRYLEYRGYRVRRVQNFTDIDDKVIARAQIEQQPVEEVAQKYLDAYVEDMAGLNFRPPTVAPRATEEMAEIVRLISGLLDRGSAYEAEGSVYFRVREDDDYGKLSHRTVDEMLQGTRVDPEPRKEDPSDFALWKASKPGEPAWESPWGMGRPGWHIECSAMAMHHLAETIDIHGGGLDLVFPHHENEIAQSETFTGRPFARFFLHHGMLRLAGDEMHKSVGNIVRISELVDRHSPDAIRLWMLTTHYRNPLAYDEDAIAAQERGGRRLRTALADAPPGSEGAAVDSASFKERFVAAMDDDLNTPQAIAALFDLAREINRGRDAGNAVDDAQAMLRELAGVLGLTLEEPDVSSGDLADDEVALLVTERTALRESRRYEEADALRARLEEQGIALVDSPGGTTWRRT